VSELPTGATRWIRISSRTVHIGALAVVVGGEMFGADQQTLLPSLVLLGVSGGLLMATDLGGEHPYLREVRGMAVLVKLGLIAVSVWWVTGRLLLLFGVIALSSVVSHMPGRYRYYALWGPQRDDRR